VLCASVVGRPVSYEDGLRAVVHDLGPKIRHALSSNEEEEDTVSRVPVVHFRSISAAYMVQEPGVI